MGVNAVSPSEVMIAPLLSANVTLPSLTMTVSSELLYTFVPSVMLSLTFTLPGSAITTSDWRLSSSL